eukprot:CAMPEP_0185593390 /NCGR_PEP_ID=MMETSP0434-20130131/71314_1 /TAXON_ID=626734 ORGANISM="Favella taraikaensis, Strain Fe Narragansett Bay" /NCGR_SAMPLE_ID=MMETSP0434 /ASSEMBLY_ACC=CAM_ASM_000379 /LENGTH=110 /DNA_ID=CAMNT_0028219937 /DNA_START=367 /DNA_END=699 /DNA_ORIENTATION=-
MSMSYSPLAVCYPPSDASTKVAAHENGGQCVAFSPQATVVVTGGGDGYVKMWDTSLHGDPRQFKAGSGFISCLAFNMPGSTLAAADSNNQINLLALKPNGLTQVGYLTGH